MLGCTIIELCSASTTSLAQIGEESLSCYPRRLGRLTFSPSMIMIPSFKRLAASEKLLSPCQPMMWAKPRLPCQPVFNPWRHSYARCMPRKAQPGSYPNFAGYFSEHNMFESEMLPPTVVTLVPRVQRVKYRSCVVMVTLLRIPRSRILRVMAGRRKGCQSSASYLLHPMLW